MKDHKDLPTEEFIKKMDELISKGMTVFVKFTCQHCSSRQTCPSANVFFSEGYDCEACGKASKPEKYGMMVVAGTENICSYDPSNPDDWKGMNIQEYATIKPKEDEREMILHMHCVNCRTIKPFTVTATLGDFFVRKTKGVSFGSTCMYCFKKQRVRLEWSSNTSWTHFEKDKEGNITPKGGQQ